MRILAVACLTLAAASATAQDLNAMLQQSIQAMNANIARGQQMVNDNVQQRMRDPAVQAAWQQYLQRTGGRPAMDYPTFTYQYIYTNGFSAQGMAHLRQTEAGIAQREHAAVQGLRQAEAQRGQAQQAHRDGYFANQQEAGRGLLGQSSYVAPGGVALQLPHTWQPNTTHRHQGQTFHVDASGRYHVLASNGYWYPLATR
ncbi:MAG: hypothetical protein ACKVQR_16625 [Aquabacterium sp.]